MRPAIPDVISVVASSYMQPIAALLDNLLKNPISGKGPAGTSMHENGYSAASVVLLVALLESYTARLRFKRHSEGIDGNVSTPELLGKYFPSLPNKDELIEVFLIRNVLAHNHIWHMDVLNFDVAGASTISTPKDLGFQPNKHYEQVVNVASRSTRLLGLNIIPTSVDLTDVRKVFDVTWRTLKFMNAQNFDHTPLAGSTVRFRGEWWEFGDIISEIKDDSDHNAS